MTKFRSQMMNNIGEKIRQLEKEIDTNQLGRRNLTPDQTHVIRGRLYNRTKKTKVEAGAIGGVSKGQNDTLINQAEVLAASHYEKTTN